MLNEVPLKSINQINCEKEPCVENVKWFINKSCNADNNEISNIILNQINIQTSLAYLYPYQNKYDSIGCQTILGFTRKEAISLQLNAMRSIYSKILLMRCNNDFYLCRVSEPFENAIGIFNNLYDGNKLNKYLSHFCLKPLKNDCKMQKTYKYTLNKNNIDLELLIKELKEDVFFDYLLNNADRYIIQFKSLPVYGFSLEEINNDRYIQAFSQLVNTLYIFILEDDINNNSCFTKHLVWD